MVLKDPAGSNWPGTDDLLVLPARPSLRAPDQQLYNLYEAEQSSQMCSITTQHFASITRLAPVLSRIQVGAKIFSYFILSMHSHPKTQQQAIENDNQESFQTLIESCSIVQNCVFHNFFVPQVERLFVGKSSRKI